MDLPPLPPGAKLNAPSGSAGLPPLPPGAKLDSPVQAAKPDDSGTGAFGGRGVVQGLRDFSEAGKDSGYISRKLLGAGADAAASAIQGVEDIGGAVTDPRKAEAMNRAGHLTPDAMSALSLGATPAKFGEAAAGAAAKGLGLAKDAVSAADKFAGKAVPSAPNMIKSEPKIGAVAARDAGFVLPPNLASDKPGALSNVLQGVSGKVSTLQEASKKNAEITTNLATKALGLPENTVLTDKIFDDVRREAGKSYEAVKTAVPDVYVDKAFRESIDRITGSKGQAASFFPETYRNDGIKSLRSDLKGLSDLPTEAALDAVKTFRFKANANLKAIGDPDKHALGLVQREAASELDNLIERNIAKASGDPDLMDNYRAARTQIAKSYDIQAATNTATGDVSARGLAKLGAKGKPLTGELKSISDAANAFPKAFQDPANFGGSMPYSALDFMGAGITAAHNPKVAAGMLTRPLARSTILSPSYQKRMMSGGLPGATPIGTP